MDREEPDRTAGGGYICGVDQAPAEGRGPGCRAGTGCADRHRLPGVVVVDGTHTATTWRDTQIDSADYLSGDRTAAFAFSGWKPGRVYMERPGPEELRHLCEGGWSGSASSPYDRSRG